MELWVISNYFRVYHISKVKGSLCLAAGSSSYTIEINNQENKKENKIEKHTKNSNYGDKKLNESCIISWSKCKNQSKLKCSEQQNAIGYFYLKLLFRIRAYHYRNFLFLYCVHYVHQKNIASHCESPIRFVLYSRAVWIKEAVNL